MEFKLQLIENENGMFALGVPISTGGFFVLFMCNSREAVVECLETIIEDTTNLRKFLASDIPEAFIKAFEIPPNGEIEGDKNGGG